MKRDDPCIPAAPPPPRPRGGRRPGAGRPPAYPEPLVRTPVRLPRSYATQLAAFGGGNLSEGIRLLVEFARTPVGDFWYVPAAPAPPRPGGPPPPPPR